MDDGQRKRFLNALRVVFTPIVKMFLHYNIGYREVAEVLKSTYVDVATKHYGVRGRPTNTSRVAAMSGISRKEVARVREGLASDSPDWERPTASSMVLNIWRSDTRFLGRNGKPIDLEFDDGPHSFRELVRAAGGDIPAGAIRKELLRTGRISQDADGRVHMDSNVSSDPQADHFISTFQDNGSAVFSAIAGFATSEDAPHRPAPIGMQTGLIGKEDLHRIRHVLSSRLAEFMESVEQLFSAYGELKSSESSPSGLRMVKIGCHYHEDIDSSG